MSKIYFRLNIFFIFIFLIFFFTFPYIKPTNNRENIEYSLSERVLVNTGRSNNFLKNIFNDVKFYFLSRKYLNQKMSSLESELDSLRYKNLILETSTDLVEKDNDSLILAKKIFSDFTSIYDTVLINKGFVNGIEKGDLVFVYPNNMIGEIENVNPKTAIVNLYSRNGNKIQAVLNAYKDDSIMISKDIKNSSSSININSTTSSSTLNTPSSTSTEMEQNKNKEIDKKTNNILIEIEGIGGGDFISSVPDNIIVSVGTIVYSANDKNKAFGEVVKIENEEASFYKKLFIRGYYNTRSDDDYYITHKTN